MPTQIRVPANRCTRLITTHPLIIVTTLHDNGVTNAGTFGSYCNLSGTELGIATGKPSHTYGNIRRTEDYFDLVKAEAIHSCRYPYPVYARFERYIHAGG